MKHVPFLVALVVSTAAMLGLHRSAAPFDPAQRRLAALGDPILRVRMDATVAQLCDASHVGFWLDGALRAHLQHDAETLFPGEEPARSDLTKRPMVALSLAEPRGSEPAGKRRFVVDASVSLGSPSAVVYRGSATVDVDGAYDPAQERIAIDNLRIGGSADDEQLAAGMKAAIAKALDGYLVRVGQAARVRARREDAAQVAWDARAARMLSEAGKRPDDFEDRLASDTRESFEKRRQDWRERISKDERVLYPESANGWVGAFALRQEGSRVHSEPHTVGR